jgi:hypothetical protein
MAQDNLRAISDHCPHGVHARPVQLVADLVAVMVADDQPFGAIELLEDRGDLVDRHILTSEIPKVPHRIGRPDDAVPLCHQVAIMLADLPVRTHGHIENTDMAEMGVSDEVVGVINCDLLVHPFTSRASVLPIGQDLSCAQAHQTRSYAIRSLQRRVRREHVGNAYRSVKCSLPNSGNFFQSKTSNAQPFFVF